ncbi:MAG TPA: DUF1579 domain-containing protein [Chitinophagaceae bacterium]|jgi:hypothetical protein
MKKITPFISLVLLLISTNIFAQSQEEMQKWTDYMTPGQMHQMVAKSDGTWNEEITMWQAPGAPPQKMTTSCENKMILGGRYQEAKHTGSFNGMPFEGYSLLGYDNIKKVFQSTWIDNMGTGTMHMEGTYDPATKMVTLTGKMLDPMSGKEGDVKQTWKFVDDNNQLVEMYNMQDGKEVKTMEIKLTRKA